MESLYAADRKLTVEAHGHLGASMSQHGARRLAGRVQFLKSSPSTTPVRAWRGCNARESCHARAAQTITGGSTLGVAIRGVDPPQDS